MAEIATLSATARQRVGKGSAREARRQGLVPAVIYGDKKEPISITLAGRAIERILHQPAFFTRLFDIEVDGETHRVLPRDAQLHPVTDRLEHVDFLRVTASSRITVDIPVHFLNEDKCKGLTRGGVLNVVRHEIEVECRPDQIPSTIDVDLAGYDIGASIHISAVTLPDGVRPVIQRDFTIATIVTSTAVRDEATAAQSGADRADAPEATFSEDED
jgi:large subunit ribosomal protein L25